MPIQNEMIYVGFGQAPYDLKNPGTGKNIGINVNTIGSSEISVTKVIDDAWSPQPIGETFSLISTDGMEFKNGLIQKTSNPNKSAVVAITGVMKDKTGTYYDVSVMVSIVRNPNPVGQDNHCGHGR
jgi:hypothetical protein